MNSITKTTRLSNLKTKKPVDDNNKTFQETLKEEDIEKLLEDYKELEDGEIALVPLNSHIRYFTIKRMPNNEVKKLFRMGGTLTNKDNPDEYVILSNGKSSWSVQTKQTVFYRKMKIDEIKEEYEDVIEEKNEEIEKLKKTIEKFKSNTNVENDNNVEEYKNDIKKYKKEVRRLRDLLKEHNITYRDV